ncbi:glycosyltransferase family 4 protein [Mucilaginibacter panaciglaebae]|uniref:Glycosyltransferase family 4 protein n=1 Tax=Mucilaginibacter panaciglaebae TaxID=502331 RepID=A0ABP7WE45_9SPHI
MQKLMRITTVPVTLFILLKEQLSFISKYFDIVAVSSPGKMLNDIADETKVKIVAIPMTRKVTPLHDFLSLVRLVGVIKKEKPLIVHTHTPKAGLLGMIAAQVAGVPIRMHTVAGMPLLEKKGLLRYCLDITEKITYSCATRVYPNSERLLQIIAENKYCSQDKLQVIGKGSSNGIDTSYFNPQLFDKNKRKEIRSALNIRVNDFVFCFIGRIVSDKGVNELVNAFLKVNAVYPSTKLLLVGPFEDHLDPLQASTKNIILTNNNIIVPGYQKDVRPYLAISTAFVFPTYREGFPNVLMQAGAMNLPCITTDINGCSEIIKHMVNGLIVPVKNTGALGYAMMLLVSDSGLVNKLSAQSRGQIKTLYEQTYVMDELLTEYRRQLAKLLN